MSNSSSTVGWGSAGELGDGREVTGIFTSNPPISTISFTSLGYLVIFEAASKNAEAAARNALSGLFENKVFRSSLVNGAGKRAETIKSDD